MRTLRKAQAQARVHFPNRTFGQGRPGRRRQGPKAQQSAAIRPIRRHGDRRASLRRPSGQAPLSAKLGRKPPPIPLTWPAMLGSRHHRARGWDRSVFSLLSVLALLAFACFPVGASADSAGAEYQTEVPSPTGNNHPATPSDTGDGGTTSGPGGGGGGGSNPSGSGSGGASVQGNAGTGDGAGAGRDSQGNGSTANPKHGDKAGDAAGSGGTLEQVASTSDESGDDGSSPLIPILIAIAVLAAISVGVVVMRQRRGPGSTFEPKAG